MSKNMTRKGLAFGAGLALLTSTIASTPAAAIDLDKGIPLAPTTGPASAYAIYAKDGASFSVTATPVSTAMAGDGTLKFLVSDPSAKFVPGSASTNSYTVSITGTTDLSGENATLDWVLVPASGVPDGTYMVHSSADLAVDSDNNGTSNYDFLTADVLTMAEVVNGVAIVPSENAVTAESGDAEFAGAATLTFVGGPANVTKTNVTITDSNSDPQTDETVDVDTALAAGTYAVWSDSAFTFTTAGAEIAAKVIQFVTLDADGIGSLSANSDDDLLANDTLVASETLVFVSDFGSARNTDNSYVVNSGVSASSTTAALEVVQLDAENRTVTVQAFVDDFNNDEIDAASEYTSSVQTITFATRSNVAWTTSLTAPADGDQTLAATMTSVPMMNGAENDDDSNFQIAFTRQGSSSTVIVEATQSAVTGTWSASVTMETGTGNLTVIDANGADTASQSWADLTRPAADTSLDETLMGVVDEVMTVDTDGTAHNLKVGDLVTFANFDAGGEVGASYVVSALNDELEVIAILGTDRFQVAAPDAADDAVFSAGNVEYTVTTYDSNPANGGIVDRVFPGDYSARAAIEDADGGDFIVTGNTSTLGTLAAVAADTYLSTVASASVQGRSVNNSTDTSTDVRIKAGTLASTVTATVVDKDGDGVGAGRAVTYTLTRSAASIRVNGLSVGSTLTTDANSQVTFAVTDTLGADGTTLTIAVTPEGVAAAATNITLEWDTQAYTVVDLNTTADEIGSATGDRTEVRTIGEGKSYVVDLLVADQWFTVAPSDTYRVVVSGQGVTEGVVTLVNGKGSVTITDAGVDDDYNTVLTLQKLTSGVWGKVVAKTLNTKTVTGTDILFAVDGSSVYEATAADLSDAVAAKALVERDTRVSYVAKPDYKNAVTVTGKVIKKTSSASQASSLVTISGPTNILFEHGTLDVAKRGSLTFIADSTNGTFAVDLYSTTAQKDTVITITANGYSETIKVTFTGIGVGEGTSLVVTAPEAVKPASTFQVKAKLADTYGNGVDTAAGRVKVTYTGPGIVFGTLPTETDANGELMFSVLLGSNDTGSVVVTVSYDQNGDADYVDAKDLNTTKTVVISASGSVSTGKVNVGSFNGKLVVYASGLNGARISWKVGGNWGSAVASSNYSIFNRPTPRAGATVSVDIYVNGVKTLTKSVVTR